MPGNLRLSWHKQRREQDLLLFSGSNVMPRVKDAVLLGISPIVEMSGSPIMLGSFRPAS
jgi:hypothetical protein